MAQVYNATAASLYNDFVYLTRWWLQVSATRAGQHRWNGRSVIWRKGHFRYLLQRRERADAA